MTLLKRPFRVKLFLLIGLPLLVGAVVLALSISDHYRMTSDVVDSGGGASTSAHYQALDAVGQPSVVGESSSTHYTMQAGFIHTLRISMLRIVCGHGLDGTGWVKLFDVNGNKLSAFKAFGPVNSRGEVQLAGGDIDEDGVDEIAAGQGEGGGSWVKLFEVDGTLIKPFKAFGPVNAQGEVHLAIGNFDINPNNQEIAVAQGEGGQSWVKLFRGNGSLIRSFKAFGPANAQGEVHLAAGDLDNDEYHEIIAGMGEGGSSWVKIFNRFGSLIRSFQAFDITENPGGEVHLAVGHFDADPYVEIAVSTGYNGGNRVKLFKKDGTFIRQFVVFGIGGNPNGEVQIASVDTDNDGTWEIICAHGEGGGSWVKLFQADGTFIRAFKAFGAVNSQGEVHLTTTE